MREINDLPVCDAMRARKGFENIVNHYTICDSLSEFADVTETHGDPTYHGFKNQGWNGGKTRADTLKACRQGDMSGVPIADSMLDKLESLAQFSTHAWRTVDDIAGGVPNVPAFLAGTPLSMRRRQRVILESAPLTLVVDLVSSDGISANDVQKRGAAVLALVRLLSNTRPVELWASIELDAKGGSKNSGAICVRLDTAPLDLARVAHVLTHPSVSRGLGYAFCKKRYNSNVHWAYGSTDVGMQIQRDHGAAQWRRALNPSSDMLYVPPIHLRDPAIQDPTKWLADMMHKYGGMEQE